MLHSLTSVAHPVRWTRALPTALLALVLCAPAQAERWALLIGIDTYLAKPELPDLAGCKNDIDLIKDVLVRDFEFRGANITTLVSSAATHAGIVDAFQSHLIDNQAIGPDDVVLVWYSGHGSRLADDNGDEPDHWDETIVPHDSRTPGVYDIRDDQLNAMMRALSGKAGQVVFVLDSCHSGSGTRGGATVREVPPDGRPQPVSPPAANALTRGAQGETGFGSNDSNWLLISACLPTELATETTFGDGERHGALTWFLHSALAAAKDGATYRSVFDQANLDINHTVATQHPQIEGPGQDVALFGTKRIARPAYALVERVDQDGVHLNAGEVQMLGVGSTLQVYPPEATDFAESGAAAAIEVVQADAFKSVARLVKGGPVTAGARAVLRSAMYANERLPVHIAPALLDLLPQLAVDLERLPALRVVDWPTQARLLVDLQDQRVTLRAADLSPLRPSLDAAAANLQQQLDAQVRATARWMGLRDLKNPAGGVAVRFDLSPQGTPAGTPLPSTVADGSELTLRVTNDEASQSLFVYILDISTDGKVYLLYPDTGGGDELKPGDHLEVSNVQVFMGNQAERLTDTFKLIATTARIEDPSIFVIDDVTRAAAREPPEATGNPLADFLTGAAFGGGTRGAQALPPKAWGTVDRPVQIGRSAQ